MDIKLLSSILYILLLMIVKGLNSHQKLTQDEKQVLICKYIRKNNKKIRTFQHRSHTGEQDKHSSETQLKKNVKLNNFNTLLTKFTNEVKKAIKQQRKLGTSVKTKNECKKPKEKKNSVSIKKLKHYNQIQYETLKKKQYNFNSLQNSMLISKKSIGLNTDKNTITLELKSSKKGESLKNLQHLTKNIYQTYPSTDFPDKSECEPKQENMMQKNKVKISRKQFVPLGKLSQTLPNNYKSYLIQNLSRYKDKERENGENPQNCEESIRQLVKGNEKKQEEKINERKKKSEETILENRMEMQRQYIKSKKIKTFFVNKSKSKFHSNKLQQDYCSNKQILTGHKYYIFNLPNAFVDTRQAIKSKKQLVGIGPWIHPNESSAMEHTS